MLLSIVAFIFAGFCIFYDFALIVLNPGTFLDNFTSFSHIWTFLGGFHIFFGIYRIRHYHSFWKSLKKWIKFTILSVFGVGIVISVINLTFILNPSIASLQEECDYVILLGGGIDKNGKLPTGVMNRVEKTAEYLLLHDDVLCVVTGGTLKWLPYPEAPEIKRQLVLKGVKENRILVEDMALDTIQNFKFSANLLADFENVEVEDILKSKIVVVTSRFHLRRAERLAKRMGFTNVKGIPTKCPGFYVLHNYVREICAYIKLNLRILLTGEPKVL